MTLTVCGLMGSPFVRKVCTQLNEKGVDYTFENLNPFQADEEFTALNPLRRIPVLKDSDNGDDFALPDSTAICHYIERKFPTSPMMPTDHAEYGRALWIEEYADTEMATKFGLGVFRSIIFPQMAGKKPDTETALKCIREQLPQIHDYLEAQLEGKDWFAGGTFGLADISVAVQYGNLAFAGYSPSAERWPKLAAFMKRVGEKDSFTNLHLKTAVVFAQMQKIAVDPSEGL